VSCWCTVGGLQGAGQIRSTRSGRWGVGLRDCSSLAGVRRRAQLAILAAILVLGSVWLSGALAVDSSPPSSVARGVQRALRVWAGFPIGASRRPVIVLGGGIVIPRRELREALVFDTGRYRLGTALPSGPSSFGGYPLISAGSAYSSLRRATKPPSGARPVVKISLITLGQGMFVTDRGGQRLPAWLFFAEGLRDPDAVLAVRPYVVPTSLRLRLPPSVVADTEEEFARASDGGKAVTISFAGGHAGNQPCDVNYTASATPSRTAVAFIIRQIPVPAPVNTGCAGVGYERTVTVRLAQPLGGRVPIDGADAIPVPVSHADVR
jgi:hypothetical protein